MHSLQVMLKYMIFLFLKHSTKQYMESAAQLSYDIFAKQFIFTL